MALLFVAAQQVAKKRHNLIGRDEVLVESVEAAAEGVDGLTPEMRKFIEEAKANGVTRCPIRDVAEQADKCPVDIKTVSPEDAKAAIEQFMSTKKAD